MVNRTNGSLTATALWYMYMYTKDGGSDLSTFNTCNHTHMPEVEDAYDVSHDIQLSTESHCMVFALVTSSSLTSTHHHVHRIQQTMMSGHPISE